MVTRRALVTPALSDVALVEDVGAGVMTVALSRAGAMASRSASTGQAWPPALRKVPKTQARPEQADG